MVAVADAEVGHARQAAHALPVTHAQALVAALHAPNVAVQNFRALVPIVLDQLLHSTVNGAASSSTPWANMP
jgi:hypothetical protein